MKYNRIIFIDYIFNYLNAINKYVERNKKNDYKSVIETLHLDATSCSTVENCVYIYISSEVHVVSRITFAESQCTEILSRVRQLQKLQSRVRKNWK